MELFFLLSIGFHWQPCQKIILLPKNGSISVLFILFHWFILEANTTLSWLLLPSNNSLNQVI